MAWASILTPMQLVRFISSFIAAQALSGGEPMSERFWLSKEAFLKIAEVSGLDMTDQHMEELYSFVQNILPSLKDIEALDLTGMEPFMPSPSAKGDSK
jgi:hypothetical protein